MSPAQAHEPESLGFAKIPQTLSADQFVSLMHRRGFLRAVTGGFLAAPLAAEAQQAGRIYRIGSLTEVTQTIPPGQGLFYDRMRELGWVYGRDFVTERRAYGHHVERIPDLVTELVRLGVDVLLVPGAIDARRVQQVTRTIPIVASDAGDLVQTGLAASLARPGGNVTGVQTLGPEMAGKLLAILKEGIPGFSRSGILLGEPGVSESEFYGLYIREAETSGKALGVRLQRVTVRRVEDLNAAFAAFRDERAQGIIVWRSPFMFLEQRNIATLALNHRLPTISDYPGFAMEGGHLSYGYDRSEVLRWTAEQIDQILRGARVGEVPIRQVTTFHLKINLKTAKASA